MRGRNLSRGARAKTCRGWFACLKNRAHARRNRGPHGRRRRPAIDALRLAPARPLAHHERRGRCTRRSLPRPVRGRGYRGSANPVAAAERQALLPALRQVGHTGSADAVRPVPYIDEVALTFPELRIVCGHPWTDETIGVAWKHDNAYIDTSAYLPRYYPPQLLQFLRTYGWSKVLFGTNFPQLPLDKCMELARGFGSATRARKQIPVREPPRTFSS